MNEQQLDKVVNADGFIAALDQSGGSSPKALSSYGVEPSTYSTDEEMFDLIHAMRSRIITSPAFGGDRILGAILFEMTMDRQVEGIDTAQMLWEQKQVVPFLKVDHGLADESDSVQLMKPINGLSDTLARAVEKGIFGTKMRSVVKMANADGIKAIVEQQFEVGRQISEAGLVPILEPEVDINSPEKAQAEEILASEIARHLGDVPAEHPVMLKLSLPSVDNFYQDLIAHERVLRVVALSGGYPRDEANTMLSRNAGMIASFSRALTQGLSAGQTKDEFDATLDATVQGIFDASKS